MDADVSFSRCRLVIVYREWVRQGVCAFGETDEGRWSVEHNIFLSAGALGIAT